jgi:predicted metalloprotease with PDZ domain
MLRTVCTALALWIAALTAPGFAQCSFPSVHSGRVLSYAFEPASTTDGATLHVRLSFRGRQGAEKVEIPTEWAGEKLHGVVNLRAFSSGTTIVATASPGVMLIRQSANRQVVLAYDVVKDWSGRFRHPAEFHGSLRPEYIEVNGDNALVHPKASPQEPVVVHFDWTKLPSACVLATSFGTATGFDGRCQSFSGPWSAVQQALFTAGEFRIRRFQIGARPAVLAVRGEWPFSDDEAIADIRKAVGVVRNFWHDDHFPYFLVTLKPFDNDSGMGDGGAFTNAFWLYLSRRDSLSDQLPTLIHETFHFWDPRRMGTSTPAEWNAMEWFREGFVSYYGYLLALRAQLISLPAYLENLNRDLRTFPVSKSGYVRGRVIALWLDQQIRKESGGRHSLDNVMYDMVSGAAKPLTQARIIETAGRYLSPAQRAEFGKIPDGDDRMPNFEPEPGPCLRGSVDEVATFRLGFDLAASSTAGVVTGVEPEGPAFKAGLRDGQRMSGRLSVYNNQPEKSAIVTVRTSDGLRAIEYYPRGAPVQAMQYDLDRQAYEADPASCGRP